MTPGNNANERPEVVLSLARALQDKLISPPALKLEEQDARINLLQERLGMLEEATSQLRLLQKKTESKALIALGMLGVTATVLFYLLAK